MSVLTGDHTYPHDALDRLKAAGVDLRLVPAFAKTEALGNSKAQNICLLGALVKVLDLPGVDWEALVADMVPAKARELNLAAFRAGFEL